MTGWPTTLRFSRRAGETVHDAWYAAAIEGPGDVPSLGLGSVVAVITACALLGASSFLLWHWA
jgi:hypothetical protein